MKVVRFTSEVCVRTVGDGDITIHDGIMPPFPTAQTFVGIVPTVCPVGNHFDDSSTSSPSGKAMLFRQALKSTISHMIPNFCASEPGAIAAWNPAAHIEEAPKKKPTTPTP